MTSRREEEISFGAFAWLVASIVLLLIATLTFVHHRDRERARQQGAEEVLGAIGATE